MFCITLLIFALSAPCGGQDELACDKVVTSDHGTLLVMREKDGSSLHGDKCLGKLRLHDPVTDESFCLAREGEREEVLDCESTTTSTTTTTTSTTITTTTSTQTKGTNSIFDYLNRFMLIVFIFFSNSYNWWMG